jgi:hypothetical protein
MEKKELAKLPVVTMDPDLKKRLMVVLTMRDMTYAEWIREVAGTEAGKLQALMQEYAAQETAQCHTGRK